MLVFSLLVFYAVLFESYPWRELAALDMPGWVIRYAASVSEYVLGSGRAPIVILGSSLILAPSQRLGDIYEFASELDGQRETIVKSTHYERELKMLTGLNLSIKNLAIHGAMLTDQELITKELIAHGNAPKLLILTLAPRDFIDNILGRDLDNTPIKRVFSFMARRKCLLPKELSLEAVGDWLDLHQKFTNLVRRKLGRALVESTCRITGRQENLWLAANQGTSQRVNTLIAAPAGSPGARPEKNELLAEDISHYRRRYLPPDEKRFTEQELALKALLTRATEAGIKVIIVEMPLTKENISILLPHQYRCFKESIQHLASLHSVSLVDFGDVKPTFDAADFIDSVHLSKRGAERFIPLFCKKVVGSQVFRAAFSESTR